jgi:hypothetical protein
MCLTCTRSFGRDAGLQMRLEPDMRLEPALRHCFFPVNLSKFLLLLSAPVAQLDRATDYEGVAGIQHTREASACSRNQCVYIDLRISISKYRSTAGISRFLITCAYFELVCRS